MKVIQCCFFHAQMELTEYHLSHVFSLFWDLR
jgi:hypothetical protein